MTLEIPPLRTYTIDETKTDNLIENYRNANITIKRSLSASHWNTLCLPFNLSSDEVKKYFGEGTELREYRNEFSNYIATFAPVKSMKAGIPYIMKPGNDIVENPTFTGVSMVASSHDSNNNPWPVGDSKVFQMKGIYNQTMLHSVEADGSRRAQNRCNKCRQHRHREGGAKCGERSESTRLDSRHLYELVCRLPP